MTLSTSVEERTWLSQISPRVIAVALASLWLWLAPLKGARTTSLLLSGCRCLRCPTLRSLAETSTFGSPCFWSALRAVAFRRPNRSRHSCRPESRASRRGVKRRHVSHSGSRLRCRLTYWQGSALHFHFQRPRDSAIISTGLLQTRDFIIHASIQRAVIMTQTTAAPHHSPSSGNARPRGMCLQPRHELSKAKLT